MTIDDWLATARGGLDRVSAADLETEMEAGAIVVDIRPVEQRQRDGELPGATVIDRNVFEWRLAPSSDSKVIDVGPTDRLIVVCNEGYQSSVAAANLQALGLESATDLDGGMQAYLEWKRHA